MKLYATNAVVQYAMTPNIYNIYAIGATITAKNTEKCAAKPKLSIAKTIKKKSNNTKRSIIIYVKSMKKTRIS